MKTVEFVWEKVVFL